MATITFSLRKRVKDKDTGIILCNFHARGEKVYWSTGFNVHNRFWNQEEQRIVKLSEYPDHDYTYLNLALMGIRDEFVRLYTLEKFSGFKPNLQRIKRQVQEKYQEKKMGSKERTINDVIYAKISVEDLRVPYVRRLLKKQGFPEHVLDGKHPIQEIKRLQVKAKRALKQFNL